MKKIGIITIHRINNYGALLQAYALNKYLSNKGFDVKTIDFRTQRVAESYKIFQPVSSIMSLARNAQAFLYKGKLKRRKRRFEEFLTENVPMTKSCFKSNEELSQAKLGYDFYICGSDQIWNIGCSNYSEAYFLSFVENSGKKISYAASMGEKGVPEEKREQVREMLKDFSCISVREKYAKDSLLTFIDKTIYTVVDPVFLLDKQQWNSLLVSPIIKKKYILFYVLRGDIEGMRKTVIKMGKDLKLQIVVVSINLREMQYKNKKCYDAGPKEFLTLVKNAEYVVTNSFHGVAMSIIFEKNFWFFSGEDKKNSSARVYNLLEQVSLLDRIISSKDVVELGKPIDYSKVNSLINVAVQESKKYLEEAIEND